MGKNIKKVVCWKLPAQSSLQQVTRKSQISISTSDVILQLLRELQRFYACTSRSSKRSNFLLRRVAVRRLSSKFTGFYKKMKSENHMKSSCHTLVAPVSHTLMLWCCNSIIISLSLFVSLKYGKCLEVGLHGMK